MAAEQATAHPRRREGPRAPRGVRNNNPGNIERTEPPAPWQGLMPPGRMSAEQAAETRFVVFADARWGFRAIARTLITYQDRHGIRTLAAAVTRWAPPSENATAAYVADIADWTGLDPEAPLDFHSYAVLRPLVAAIARKENGGDFWPASVIDAGLALAGVEPGGRAIETSRTLTGVAAGTAATAGLAFAEVAREAAPAVGLARELAAITPWLAIAVLILALGLIAWARFDDWRRLGR